VVNFLLKYQFCELGNNVCPIQRNAWIVWDSPSSASLSVNLNFKFKSHGLMIRGVLKCSNDVLKCFLFENILK